MNGSAASVAYWIVPLTIGVLILIVLAMVALAVRKEDSRRFSLRGAAPGMATRATRRLTRFGAAGLPVQPRGRVS